jgi:hypothetical protein
MIHDIWWLEGSGSKPWGNLLIVHWEPKSYEFSDLPRFFVLDPPHPDYGLWESWEYEPSMTIKKTLLIR